MRGPLAAAAVGAIFLAWIAGARLVDPRSIEWLMKGDWVPHQFGWHYFRLEPWHWPPGRVLGYHAPLGTSIGLTDSIPLAAYLLKPFSPWLPAEFQYLGPWLLLCFTLQGALGARLVGRFSPAAVTQWLGGTLFVLLPTLLARVAHAALVAHWLVLWALLIATRAADRRYRALEWAALGLVAGMTQPYLAAMVLPLLAAVALDALGAAWPRRLAALGAAVAATVTGWWLSGLFVLQGEGALAEGGLGYFSTNLASFVVHGGWSRWMPTIPLATEGQTYEGFHYLGAGLLGLVAVAAVLARRQAGVPRVPPLWPRWVLAVAIAMALFALSPRVTLGPYVLVDVTGPWTAPLAMFRSSGRFVWPLTYVLLTWAIVTVDRRAAPRTALGVLALAVVVQVADLRDAYRFRHDAAHDPAFHTWTNPFASPAWDAVLPTYRHVALVPPPQCGEAPYPYEGAMRLAARHHATLNAGVVARADAGARRRYCADADATIDRVDLADDTLYLVSPEAAGIIAAAGGARVSCGAIGGAWTCTTASARTRWPATIGFDAAPSAPAAR